MGQDGLRRPHLLVIVIEQRPVGVDAADADHRHVDPELAERVAGKLAQHRPVAVAHGAARHDDVELRRLRERERDVQVVGDDAEIVVPGQLPGDRLGRRADVDEDRAMRRDPARRETPDPGLFRQQRHPAIGVVDVLDAGGQAAAAAVALQPALGAQLVQIAADRLDGDAELRGERLDGDEARWRTEATMALRRPSTPVASILSSDLRSSGRDIDPPWSSNVVVRSPCGRGCSFSNILGSDRRGYEPGLHGRVRQGVASRVAKSACGIMMLGTAPPHREVRVRKRGPPRLRQAPDSGSAA